jgi:chromosome segregation ATPase
MAEKDDGTGFLDKVGKVVGDIIFEKEDVERPVQDREPADIKPSQAAAAPPSSQNVPQIDKAIYEKLKVSTETKAGAFIQLTDMANSLKDVIADEATRFAAALKAVGKTSGITYSQVVQSLDAKLAALNEENSKFENTIKQKITELDDMNSQITSRQQKIDTLKAQISQLETEQKDIMKKISSEKSKIEGVKGSFSVTSEVLRAEIVRQKESMMKYLKGGS